MTSARDQILGNIRRSLGTSDHDQVRQQVVDARVAAAQPGIEPARGTGTAEQRIATFTAQVQTVSASVARIETDKDAPGEIARFLRDHNLPASIRMGEDERLTALDWKLAGLDVALGKSSGDDLNAVSHALGGIAETGTLALVSGAHNPTTLNFLPDNHIVIVHAETIVPTYEAVFAHVRERYGKGAMPRTVNLITGPSRSADIEQKLLLGAHGPRRLHVVVVG